MNWEHQDYSFSYPNAPPLTPNKTPTTAAFPSPSPTLRTPQNNNFEIHSGWTPTFAEEYSVFNATPGRLLDAQQPILDAQGQPISNQQHALSASEETFPSGFPNQFQQPNSTPKLPLPPVEASRRLSSSPRPLLNISSSISPTKPSVGIEKAAQKVTPKKTKGRLEEPLSSQTVTPPHTSSRGIRRLAAKPALAPSSMSQTHEFGEGSSGTQQNHVPLLDFSNTSMDSYGYPMSAPATAPSYLQGKSFWDTDSSMTALDIDFNLHNGTLENSFHKQSNSLDWGRSNEMFQNTANHAPFNMDANGNSNIVEPESHSKPLNFDHMDRHNHSYEPDRTSGKDSQFASPTRTGVVNPGLIFSFPVTSSGFQQEPMTASSDHNKSQTAIKQPYQHQIRESRRDQQEEELRRSRPSSQASFHSRDGRASFVSPTRADTRANLQRSFSENNSLKLQYQPQRAVSNLERSSRSRERRLSPIKNQNRTSLTSIPESSGSRTANTPVTRTDITFTIDANGRARTETTIILSDQPRKRSASSANSGDWDDSRSESSSDDEILIVPSRNTSFSLPEHRRSSNAPRTARFERSHSKRGRGSSVYSQSSGEHSHRAGPEGSQGGGDPESEAETVVEQDERSGNAASALRKVLQNRRTSRTSRHVMADVTPTRSSHYTSWEGMTPSDHDVDTPSTDRSGITRCVCGKNDSDGKFMIQCESCSRWLHAQCVGIDRRNIPHVFICTLCTFTPSARGRLRDGGRSTTGNFASSPLTRKSFR